jgi:hypothetical protein
VEYVEPGAAGFDERMFVNLNAPEDLENVK